MKKGSQILVEGRMETRSWDDAATNTKKYRTEVIADTVQFGAKNTGGGNFSSTPSQASTPKKEEEIDTIEYPEEQINAEDIPF
jgi:single-strand DNA-binding protein